MVWGRKRTAERQSAEVARAWQRALRAAVSEDWQATETWLERIVEADSSTFDAYLSLARLYRQQGAVGRAIRMHQNLLLRTDLSAKDRDEALFELARDFEDGGFGERAVASYEEFLAQHPRHAEALEHVIPLLQAQREHARALALLKKLARREPEIAARLERETLLAEARVCLDEGDHAGARQALKRCLRRNKESAEAHAMLGELEAERGKSARALDAWKHAVRSLSEDRARLAPALYAKIDAGYAASGKPVDFDAFLREILSVRPDDSHARIALARALARRGETAAATEELARAIELRPDDPALRAELGRLLLAANQEAEALKAYAEWIERIARTPSGEETVV